MTPKAILLTALILICLSIFAQETKLCLFIGRYDKDRTYCSSKGWVHEVVKDRQEYELMRVQFREAHKADVGMTYPTDFVSDKECAIVYEYQRRNGAFNCNQTFVSIITGASVEICKEQLAKQIASNGKDYYLAQPNIIYTKKIDKDGFSSTDYSEDFDGVSGKFSLRRNAAGVDVILARLTNTTKDKLAIVTLKRADGQMIREFVNPGATFSNSYECKKVDVEVLYMGFDEPRPKIEVIKFVKDKLRRQITNEHGKLVAIGVRG